MCFISFALKMQKKKKGAAVNARFSGRIGKKQTINWKNRVC
jgi:hypothetical protein